MKFTSEGHETNSIRLATQRSIIIDPKFVLIGKVDAEICKFQSGGHFRWRPFWIYANEVVPNEFFRGHPSEKFLYIVTNICANFGRLFQKGTILAYLCTYLPHYFQWAYIAVAKFPMIYDL